MAASDSPGPINVGSQHEISVLKLAKTIRRLAQSNSEITFIDRPIDDPTVRRPDITLASELLSRKPTTPFEDGLKRTISWFREQEMLPRDV
jgi:dTDP-glucose 4,6-dehydratase